MPKVKREDDKEISERAKKLIRLNKAKQFSQHLNAVEAEARKAVPGVSDVKFVCSRIAHDKVYARFPQFPKEIYDCVKIPSYLLTEAESQLLNEINFRHSDSFFGKIVFKPNVDVKISLEDLEQSNDFYHLCKRLLSDYNKLDRECCGFIRIDQRSYVPFVRRGSLVLLPTFYFEGDNCDLALKSLVPTKWEMTYLRLLCQIQQIKKDFYTETTCRVMDLEDIKNLFSEGAVFEESWPHSVLGQWIQTIANSNPLLMKKFTTPKIDEAKTTVINRDDNIPSADSQASSVISNIRNNITLIIHPPLTMKTGPVNHQQGRVMSVSNDSNMNINVQSTGAEAKDNSNNSVAKINPHPKQTDNSSNFGIVYPPSNKKNTTKKSSCPDQNNNNNNINSIVQLNEKAFYTAVKVSKLAITPKQRMLVRQLNTTNEQPKIVQLAPKTGSPRSIKNGSTTRNDPKRSNYRIVQQKDSIKKAAAVHPSTRELSLRPSGTPTRELSLRSSDANANSVPNLYTVGTILVFSIPFICVNVSPHVSTQKPQGVLISTTDVGLTFFPNKFLSKVDAGLQMAGLKLYKLCEGQRAAFEKVRKVVGKDEMFVEAARFSSDFFKLRYYIFQ